MKQIIRILIFTLLLYVKVFCQDTSVAITAKVDVTRDYGYAGAFGGELVWFINVPQTLKIKKNLVYVGSFEVYKDKKIYTNSGYGFTTVNKARYYINKNIFIEGGAKNGWYYTDFYSKRATFILAGGGYKFNDNHYLYYNYGQDIHKFTDDGINYISNKQKAHYLTYDSFLPLTKKIYLFNRINYTHGCASNNNDTVRYCGNFYNFNSGIGFK